LPKFRVATAVLLSLSAAAAAQVPPDIAAQIRAAGQSMDPGISRLYAPLFPPSAWEGVTIERDLAYGGDPRQKLDVYTPSAGGKDMPVLLFVHGGAFVGGSKHGPFYPDNITAWAAKQGMVGVGIDYRIAPANPWPAGAQDLASAIAWTHANIARYGGDPDRIVLFGHSAGGNHVADYVGNPSVQGSERSAVKGAVLVSPNYPVSNQGGPPHAYYGADTDLNSTAGTVARLRAAGLPLFVADAEFDPDMMQATATALRDGLCRTPAACPRSVHLANHNHFTEGMAIGTDDQSLSGPVLEWISSLMGERG
jgi:triacylglycerol lipase